MLAVLGSKPFWGHFLFFFGKESLYSWWNSCRLATRSLVVEEGLLSLYSPHASLVSSLSIQSCLFSVGRMQAVLSSPSSIARLHHFLSISSPDEYHSPPPILLCLFSPPSAIFVLLCHFFSICNLDRQLYLPLSVSP